MARAVATVALALLLAPLGSPREARAGATVDLLFVGRNGAPLAATNQIYALPGDEVTMAVLMRNDQPLTAAIFSLRYDLRGENSLDVVSAFQWRGVGIAGGARFKNVAGLQPTTPTFVGSFQGFTTQVSPVRTLPKAGGAFAGGYQMGTVVWRSFVIGSETIISGILAAGVDVFGDAAFNDISNTVLFRSAVVNSDVIPEPAAAALLGLGVVGLALLRRRVRGGASIRR